MVCFTVMARSFLLNTVATLVCVLFIGYMVGVGYTYTHFAEEPNVARVIVFFVSISYIVLTTSVCAFAYYIEKDQDEPEESGFRDSDSEGHFADIDC